MLKINVIFFIILKLVNTYKQYYMDLSSGDFDDKIYPFTQTISEFPNEGIEIHITFPGTKFPGHYYFIFDYYFSNSQRCTINVLNKTYTTNYDKIVIRLNNTDKFELNAQLYGSTRITALGYDYLINFIFSYSYFPYFYYLANKNISIPYNYNDDFRIILNITDFEKHKTYYLYNTFYSIKNPDYKLCESKEDALIFNFINYDGQLSTYTSNVSEFIKTNEKYNYLILHFVGDKNHTNSSDEYGRSYAFMAILEDHPIYKFYPEIPSIIIPSIFVIITAVLFYSFHCVKKTKQIKINETDANKKLIEK